MLHAKIMDANTLADILKDKQAQGQTVVFTNGCFDILHAGHVQYLEEASGLGDLLVLGLNSDASVKRLKGKDRPINHQDDRAIVMAALEAISYVTIFDEDTPYDLIRLLSPDVLVKGGDWSIADIVGSDLVLARGGKVLSLGFSEGLSTTAIINKVKENKHD